MREEYVYAESHSQLRQILPIVSGLPCLRKGAHCATVCMLVNAGNGTSEPGMDSTNGDAVSKASRPMRNAAFNSTGGSTAGMTTLKGVWRAAGASVAAVAFTGGSSSDGKESDTSASHVESDDGVVSECGAMSVVG